ncbi:FISUMP domain-containing protein, partial [Parabacteroides chinchillae]
SLSPALSVGDNAWPRDQQPCPAGWRVPTKAELDPIMIEANGPNKMDGTNKIWKAGENANFVLPAAGYRDGGSSSSGNLASFGSYWSSTLNASGKSSYLFFGSSSAGTALYSLASSLSVRCVQE